MTYPPERAELPYLPQPAPPRTHRIRTTVFIIIGIIGGFLIGLGVGGTGGSTPSSTAAAPAATATVTTVETLTATVAPAPTKTVAPKPAPKPAPTFDDGSDPDTSQTAVAGDDIPTGTYEVKGAPGDCYWEVDTANGSIVSNNDGGGHQTAHLRKKGWQFQSEDCGVWHRTGA